MPSSITAAQLMLNAFFFGLISLDKFTYFNEDLSCPALETRYLALQQRQ
jgi:hypothetical protein